MEAIKYFFYFLQVLVIPILIYVVKLEKRMVTVETLCKLHMKGMIKTDKDFNGEVIE